MELEENEQTQSQNSAAGEQAKDVTVEVAKGTAKVASGIVKTIVFIIAHPAITAIAIVVASVFCGAVSAMALSLSDEGGFENILQHTEETSGRISSSDTSSGSTVAPGENGYQFYQKDYEDIPFGYTGANIKTGGCGITSMAMCISDIYGKSIDPRQLTSEFDINPYWVDGSGVAWSFFFACAEHYNLQCQELGTSPDAVVQALKEGKKVISSQDADLGSQFTGGGHIIYFYGLDSEGKIVVKDPNYYNIEKGLLSHTWDPATICSWSKNNFAIWK